MKLFEGVGREIELLLILTKSYFVRRVPQLVENLH